MLVCSSAADIFASSRLTTRENGIVPIIHENDSHLHAKPRQRPRKFGAVIGLGQVHLIRFGTKSRGARNYVSMTWSNARGRLARTSAELAADSLTSKAIGPEKKVRAEGVGGRVPLLLCTPKSSATRLTAAALP